MAKEYKIDFTEKNHRAQTINDVLYEVEVENGGHVNSLRMNKATMKKVMESMRINWVKKDGSSTHKDTVLSREVVIGYYAGYTMDIDDEIEDDVAIITYDTEENIEYRY